MVIPRDPGDGVGVESRVPLTSLIGRWSLWSMSIAHFASNYVFYFLLSWLPLFLTKSRGLPVREMTLIATLGYAVQAIAALVFGASSDWWTRHGRSEAGVRRAMMICGQFLAGTAVLGVAYAKSPAEIAALLCIAGLATGALSLNIYAVAQMFSGPRAAGSWVGFQNALGNLSGIAGPIVTGIIVANAGYNSAFVVTAAVGFAGAIWWAVAVPKIEQISVD
jgi:MFS family permease